MRPASAEGVQERTKLGVDSNPQRTVQRIEALSLYGYRWALSEDSGFNSYLSRREYYLVKNVVR